MKLEVIGVPAPQGSKSAYVNKNTGRAVVVEGKGPGRAALTEWRRAIADAARQELERNPAAPMDGPLAVKIYFRFTPTASDPYRFWHAVKPDLDKLARAVFDSLKMGGAIADDAKISALTTKKRFANETESPGCSIEIVSLASEEAEMRENRKAKAARARRQPAPDMERLAL